MPKPGFVPALALLTLLGVSVGCATTEVEPAAEGAAGQPSAPPDHAGATGELRPGTGNDAGPDTARDAGPDTATDAGPATDGGPGDANDTGVPGDGGFDATTVDLTGCYATRTCPFSGGNDMVEFVRYEYEPDRRILTEHTVSNPTSDAAPTSSLHYRVDEAGFLVTYAGSNAGPFRHDYYRDAAHNVTRFEFVYEAWTDLEAPTTSVPYMSYAYAHTYDASGRLTSSTLEASDYAEAQTLDYTHDAEGRCSVIETTFIDAPPFVETRSYEGGRLAETVLVREAADGVEPQRIVTTFSYDDAGRLTAREQDGGGHWGATADGQPDITEYWSYAADGSYSYDTRDYTTDVPNDSVEVDGQLRSCAHGIFEYSAACAALARAIPRRPATLECRFDQGRDLPL